MADCTYFQQVIKELNPSDSNTGDCCGWSMVECDKKGTIVKLDFSNYKGIDKKVALPQTMQFLSNLKEFSIKGQKNINEIYSLATNNLEKVDLSDSGLSSSIFPTWILDAQNIKELDISNTQITGLPQREIKSTIKSCNFSNTPICASYQSSPYANFVPDSCKSSCSGGYTPPNASNGKKTNSEGGSSAWVFILIGVAVIAILGALGFLYMKKAKKRDDELSNYDSPRPILPVSKRDDREEKDNESFEIAVDGNTQSKISEIAPANAAVAPVAPVAVPQAAAVVNHDSNNKKIEEVARNNYTTAYGGDAKQNVFNTNRASGSSVKDIYRQHNVSTVSEQDQSYYPHPSIYNTMTTDIDSDDEVSDINQPIIADLKNEKEKQEQPALLRRKSSRKNNNIKETTSKEEDEAEDDESDNEDELYVANWDYAPTLSDELALAAGDVIEIKKKFDDGWSTGYNRRTKQTGIVPLCYLKEYEE